MLKNSTSHLDCQSKTDLVGTHLTSIYNCTLWLSLSKSKSCD